MSQRLYVLLFEVVFFLSVLSQFHCLSGDGGGNRGIRFPLGMAIDGGGYLALTIATLETVGSMFTIVLLGAFEFPENLRVWLIWSRIALVASGLAISLSLYGRFACSGADCFVCFERSIGLCDVRVFGIVLLGRQNDDADLRISLRRLRRALRTHRNE